MEKLTKIILLSILVLCVLFIMMGIYCVRIEQDLKKLSSLFMNAVISNQEPQETPETTEVKKIPQILEEEEMEEIEVLVDEDGNEIEVA